MHVTIDSSSAHKPDFQIPLDDEAGTVLYAEQLRDGRIALGTVRHDGDKSAPAEMHLLGPPAYLALAAWLAGAVESAWLGTVRDRQPDQLATAHDLYGEGRGAVERLAGDLLEQIPRPLLVRALILLLNSIGPQTRERLVARLNSTEDTSEDAAIRRQLGEQQETFAYAVAAAAVFDALAHLVDEP